MVCLSDRYVYGPLRVVTSAPGTPAMHRGIANVQASLQSYERSFEPEYQAVSNVWGYSTLTHETGLQ